MTCMNCNGPLGFEPQMCCTNGEWANPNSPCGCMGYPIDPPFCSKECEESFSKKCGNCEGEGWVLITDNGLPNQDKCQDCDGTGKLWTEECQVCGDPVKVNQDYEIVTCGKPGCHDKIIGRWGI